MGYMDLILEEGVIERFPFNQPIIEGRYDLMVGVDRGGEAQLDICSPHQPYTVYFLKTRNTGDVVDLRILIDFGGYWNYNLIDLYRLGYDEERDTDGKPDTLMFALDMGRRQGIEIKTFRKILRDVKEQLEDLGIKFK